MGSRILLTGATGFVGKVVLEELVRRRAEIDLERVHLVIRPAKGQTPRDRLLKLISSPAFSKLPRGWETMLGVVEADLSDDDGLTAADPIARELTHIVHCAASVDFELPVAQAARANITSSLNVLAFARRCPSLIRMTSVSTAYVTPHSRRRGGMEIHEAIVPLPRSAQSFYDDMRKARDHEEDRRLLDETGHPNTYTLTKCVAEHLLTERRGHVPLSIIRPSIVSACRQYPFPGWIDSRAALAGFVTLIGMGHLRAVVVEADARLDIMPCDDVAERVINATFTPDDQPLRIRHATAGRMNSNTIATNIRIIEDYYARYPLERRAVLHYRGHAGVRFTMHNWLHHRLPLAATAIGMKLTGRTKQQKSVVRLQATIDQLHNAFPYFTQNTFDFKTSMPLPADFNPETYLEIVCAGVYRHLLRKDERLNALAGKQHKHEQSDLSFATSQPRGNATVRALGFLVRKGLRACVESVTVDQPTFEAAVAEVPRNAVVVIVPTHRSYMDFLLAPLLFFAKPELGIAPPQIAAAEEFAKIPIVGKIFERAGAFFIKRGIGRANPELNTKLRKLAAARESIMFFIEGKRSRDRRFVAPKTGLLRALSDTGERIVILPISISYDRVPEEDALLGELRSGQKPEMGLAPLLAWAGRLVRGEVSLGRIHLVAGKPIHMNGDNDSVDIKDVAHSIMRELQTNTVTTMHHLEAFVRRQPIGGSTTTTIDAAWLKAAIIARGGQVLDSELRVEEGIDPLAELCMRQNWIHLFYPEALAMFHNQPDIVAMIESEHYARPPIAIDGDTSNDPRVAALLRALFSSPSLAERAKSPSDLGRAVVNRMQRLFDRAQ